MTELTPAGHQNGRFHETRIPNAEVRWLVDEWLDALELLAAAVADELGIPTPLRQMQALSAPSEFTPKSLNDPRALLGPVFDYQQDEGAHNPDALARSAELLSAVFNKDLERMREWWAGGYFARVSPLVLDGKHYRIYNHQPAFVLTGLVQQTTLRDIRNGELVPWLSAVIDTEPLRDGDGDFIPVQPDLPVVVLPTMSYERFVTRDLANAHLDALRSSLAPWVIDDYAPNLRGVPKHETAPKSIDRILARLALLVPEGSV
jgi:hypothetical protein